MNAARRGGGIGESAPRIERQMISFNSSSGARSASRRFIRNDASAPQAVEAFFSSIGTRGGSALYGVITGVG